MSTGLLAAVLGATERAAHVLSSQAQPLSPCTTRPLFQGGRDGVWRMDDQMFQEYNEVRQMGEAWTGINITTCRGEGPQAHGTTSWMLGPFVSHGGYDWWEIDFEIPWEHEMLTTAPHKRVVGGYSFTFHEGSVPTAGQPAGRMIGLPPLHHHHTTFIVGGTERTTGNCHGGSQHLSFLGQSDGQCSGEETGYSCLNMNFTELGYAIETTAHALPESRVGAHVNDMRPANSPAFHWYYNVTMTFVDPYLVGPYLTSIAEYSTSYPVKLDTQFRTFDVPASEDGFAIYEGRWPFTGDVLTDTILTKHHAHVGHFHFNLLIAGSARELGLDREQFFSRSGCDAVATRHAGYSSNLDMLAKLIERCPRCFSMTAANSRVLCAANASAAEVHDRSLTNTDQPYRYNRRAAVRCNGNGFRVRENAVYTSLSFFGVQPTFPGPAHLYESGMNTPGFYPMHSTWSFFYKADNITAQVKRDNTFPMVSGGRLDESRCTSPDF